MEPQIRYVRSDDGTSIAYAILGEGRPLLLAGGPGNLFTLDTEWRIPRVRRSIEQLAERRMFVRADARGRGLSDRDVGDRSLDAHVADLRCVVEALPNHPVDLMAGGAAVITAFAARYPHLVRRAVITLTLGLGFRMSPLRRKLGEVAQIDYDFYRQALALLNFGWVEGQIAAEQLGDLTLDEMNAGYRVARAWDNASADFQRVQCPVLVVHRRGAEMDVPLADSRNLASSLPRGELRVVDAGGTTMFDEAGLVVQAVIEFLDRDEPHKIEDEAPSGTAIILFADLVDSTALTERLGDAAFRDQQRALDGRLRSVISECGGSAVGGRTLGDGVLASFASARDAIAAARQLADVSNAAALPLHIGLHAGDVLRDDDADGRRNVWGGAVNIAARISSLTAPGEILVSATVRDLARTSAGVVFEDRGEHALKGVGEAQRVYAVRQARGTEAT